MDSSEIHKYGIDLIVSYLKKEGYVILEVNQEVESTPQIVAQKVSQIAFIIVKTFMYPKKDVEVEQSEIDMLIDGIKAYNAKCYIAKVGLACASAKNKNELGCAFKDSDFFVKFKGLQEVKI